MKARNTKTPPKTKRPRRAKPLQPEPVGLTEEEKKAHEEHVAKLVKRGRVRLGTGGPPIPELLKPGPRCKGDVQAAVRWAKGYP